MPLPRPTILRSSLAACLLLTTALPAAAQTARVAMTSQDIEMAEYTGGDLPAGQSALTARVQILLDRSGVSPGVVDGFKGGMSQSAILAFERGHGLPQDGIMDAEIWNLLHAYAAAPVTMDYTIVDADAEGLVDSIPADYAEKAAMTSQGYTSVVEKLGERFHMDDKFLAQLNPGAAFVPGETIRVTVPAKPIKAKVARIIVDKQTSRVAAYDANGRMVADYPATVGSGETPSPHGVHKVTAVALDPTYTYDPSKNFKQGDNDKVLRIPPGPNAPVGNVWIDLSKPTYGIHGTPTPSKLFVNQSNGCVRLTNWDAQELARMVQPGQTVVDFLAPGVAIADVTPAVAPTILPDPSGIAAATTNVATAGQDGAAPAPTITASRPAPRRTLPGTTPVSGTMLPADAPVSTAATDEAVPVPSAPLPVPGTDPLAAALSSASDGALDPQALPAPAQPGVLPGNIN